LKIALFKGLNRVDVSYLYLRTEIDPAIAPPRLGCLELEAIKCGHESRVTMTREGLRWRDPAADTSSRQRGCPIITKPRLPKENVKEKESIGHGPQMVV
jgi:hypothetical protein